MKIIIVIPTYNEAENISRLIDILNEEFKKSPNHEFGILVVDGNSPDGTADRVKQKSEQYPHVHLLLEKEKKGLGAAYIYAFKHAMEHLNPDVLIEMDADFQHDPKYITQMVQAIDEGYDYVIGSRFISGGGIPDKWQLHRKLISVGGNIFSKFVLGIFNVNDFTSGFKASRVKGFVDKLDLDSVLSGGFAYKIDLLFKMHRLGAKIKEIPIMFGLRDRGDSKMERNNLADSLRVVITLRVNENKSFFKFVIVGFIGLFVDGGSFNVLRLIQSLGSSYASLISGGLGMLTTFLLNNYWSFGERKLGSVDKKIIGIIIYFASSSIPIIARKYIIKWFTLSFGDTFIISNFAFFIGIVLGLIWNFTVYSKIIWKRRSDD